jgi:hypothetical protein
MEQKHNILDDDTLPNDILDKLSLTGISDGDKYGVEQAEIEELFYYEKNIDKQKDYISWRKKYRKNGNWLPIETWDEHDRFYYIQYYKNLYILITGVLESVDLLSDNDKVDSNSIPIKELKEKCVELKKRIIDYLKVRYYAPLKFHHNDLIPTLNLKKSVTLKRDVALTIFGGADKIRELYPKILNTPMMDGRDVNQHLKDLEDWYNSLHGEDLGMWVKLFGFAQAVMDHKKEAEEVTDLHETARGSGVFAFWTKRDKSFYQFFIHEPDQTKKNGAGYYSSKAKDKINKWLLANRNAIKFPFIVQDNKTGQSVVFPEAQPIYNFEEGIEAETGKTYLLFTINTNILDTVFKSYVSIKIAEVDLTAKAWEQAALDNPKLKSNRLDPDFQDLPLRFLLTLKEIYNPGGDFIARTGAGGVYKGNTQRLSIASMDTHLGNLTDRILVHVLKNHLSRAKDGGRKVKEIKALLFNTLFDIAMQRKWLVSIPYIDDANENFVFNLNAGYFAPRETRAALKSLTDT